MSDTTRESRRMKNGRDWEELFFGYRVETELDFEYLELRPALQEAARIQKERNWDPSNPSTRIAQRLFEKVKVRLKPEDRADLQLYSALGTALDQYHKTDGFFKIREHVVLIDLTTGNKKIQTKALILKKSDLRGSKMDAIVDQIVLSFYKSIAGDGN